MMYDYLQDPIGQECLKLVDQCRAEVGFGAVLIKKGTTDTIIGRGRNRRSTAEDRRILTHVDYAIHAEQDCVLQALKSGYDVSGGAVYVLGKSLMGKEKGKLTTRDQPVFICHKCPHTFLRYNLSVFIPHIMGWMELTAKEALKSGLSFYHKGYWKKFVKSEVF
jgi:hypothetical protein